MSRSPLWGARALRRFATAVTGLTVACGPTAHRQEQVAHMTPIGVDVDFDASTTDRIVLTLVVATPVGYAVDVVPAEAAALGGAAPAQLASMTIAEQTYAEHFGLRVLTVRAQLTPSLAVTGTAPDGAISTLSYAFDLREAGLEKIVVGRIPLVGAQPVGLVPADVGIAIAGEKLTALRAGKSVGLEADILGNVDLARYRVGWYVSGGEVGNRKLSSTTWRPSTAGRYTLIAAARPVGGVGFAFDVLDVEVAP